MSGILEQIKNTLAAHLPDLKKRYPIGRLTLFGSVTRKDFDPDRSDIDILVEFNGDIGWEFFDLHEELEKILNRKVDLVSKRALKPHYLEHIKKDLVDVL
ncbi:MAG: nucleotidyltransferase family protein [Chitinophagales bacterium]